MIYYILRLDFDFQIDFYTLLSNIPNYSKYSLCPFFMLNNSCHHISRQRQKTCCLLPLVKSKSSLCFSLQPLIIVKPAEIWIRTQLIKTRGTSPSIDTKQNINDMWRKKPDLVSCARKQDEKLFIYEKKLSFFHCGDFNAGVLFQFAFQ